MLLALSVAGGRHAVTHAFLAPPIALRRLSSSSPSLPSALRRIPGAALGAQRAAVAPFSSSSSVGRAAAAAAADGGPEEDTAAPVAEGEEQQQQHDRGDEADGRPAKKPKEKLRAIRQHVNPLSRLYQQPVDLPEGWVARAFADPGKPFHVDIGSARGRFCVDMSLAYPGTNFLGLEIRRPCVEEAFKKMERSGAGGNCHFLALNANVDIDRVVADIQRHAEIIRYSIQFPDPHFKKKHKKRRMVQPALVASICRSLRYASGGEILIQSDVEEVAQAMRECFQEDPSVEDVCKPGEWMPENPLGVPTEREKLTLGRGDPVYRTLFKRKPDSPPA